MKKRLFAVLLSLVLVLAAVSLIRTVRAEGEGTYPSGWQGWLKAAKEEALQKADHVICPEDGINEIHGMTIIMPGETVAVVPRIDFGLEAIQGGISAQGINIIQLYDPVVNTDFLRTSTPKKTTFTELEKKEVPVFYGERDITGDPVRIVEGITSVEYVSLYRNDTGLPVLVRGNHWQSGTFLYTKSADPTYGVGKADERRTNFQATSQINYAPLFYFAEPSYELTLWEATSAGKPYEWRTDDYKTTYRVYVDAEDHTYEFNNPMVEEWCFLNWEEKKVAGTAFPVNSEGKAEGGVTKFTWNMQAQMLKNGDMSPNHFLSEHTLAAVFLIEGRTFRLDANGGTIRGKETLLVEAGHDDEFNASLKDYTPVREGYDFLGWCTDREDPAGTLVENATAENWKTWFQGKHMNFYAAWKEEDKITAFVTRCYQLILGRNPDPHGLETWYNNLNSGLKAAAEIIDSFVRSNEFKGKNYSSADAVEILYKTMLGRGSDPGGKAGWVAKLDAGQPLAAVINGFCGSKEFKAICDSYGIRPGSVDVPEEVPTTPDEKIKAFVKRCYKIILGRGADETGLNNWFNALKSRERAASEIIDGFVRSVEFKGKNYSSEESVEILYKAMLGRGSDPKGKANWVAKLNAGQPLAVVINGFCGSQEFTGLCESYGIEPGRVSIPEVVGQAEAELSYMALNAEEPITKRSEDKPNRVEIINPSDTVNLQIGTAVQAVYINEEKAKEFVSRCYQYILGRNAGENELAGWVAQMTNGTKTADQIARGFLFSGEFKGKNVGNEDLVKILYRVYLNRDADPAGLASWTAKLDSGMTLKDLLDSLVKTSEYKNVISEMGK